MESRRVIGQIEDGVVYEVLDDVPTSEQLLEQLADARERHWRELDAQVRRWRGKAMSCFALGVLFGVTMTVPEAWSR